jgi:hypothetical protein
MTEVPFLFSSISDMPSCCGCDLLIKKPQVSIISIRLVLTIVIFPINLNRSIIKDRV